MHNLLRKSLLLLFLSFSFQAHAWDINHKDYKIKNIGCVGIKGFIGFDIINKTNTDKIMTLVIKSNDSDGDPYNKGVCKYLVPAKSQSGSAFPLSGKRQTSNCSKLTSWSPSLRNYSIYVLSFK